MKTKKSKTLYIQCIALMTIIFSQGIILSPLIADVPYPTTHKPTVPYHMQYINFQPVQLDIFGEYISGMLVDPYADLSWNPAFILSQSQSSAYLKINFHQVESSSSYYINPEYYDSYTILPRWYSSSTINILDAEPIYHIAFLKTISSKLSFGIINRSIIDYGPYRSTLWWDQGGWDNERAASAYVPDLEPQTLHVDKNNQHILGNHLETYLGYQLSPSLAVGVKLGHYLFRQEGQLYDSKWGYHPHNSYADLNDESLNIDGDQYEGGIGLIYYFNQSTSLGIYGSYMSGSTSDIRAVQDTSDYWSENAEDTKYYDLQKYDMFKDEKYSSDDSQPLITLTFEKKFSPVLRLRSFIKSCWLQTDIKGTVSSQDTTYRDRTYDDYDNGSYYFRRYQYHRYHNSDLQGQGETRSSTFQWFTSLIYAPDKKWSLLGGIYFSRSVLDREITENSDYLSRFYGEYSKHDPETRKTLYTHEKNYAYELHTEQWRCILPLGFRTTVVKGFDIIMGADIRFIGSDSQEKGALLYPQIINKSWKNKGLIVNDFEEDRYELYNSDPSFSLRRETTIHLGATYEHASGLRIYLKTESDFSDMDYWALGFEMIL